VFKLHSGVFFSSYWIHVHSQVGRVFFFLFQKTLNWIICFAWCFWLVKMFDLQSRGFGFEACPCCLFTLHRSEEIKCFNNCWRGKDSNAKFGHFFRNCRLQLKIFTDEDINLKKYIFEICVEGFYRNVIFDLMNSKIHSVIGGNHKWRIPFNYLLPMRLNYIVFIIVHS